MARRSRVLEKIGIEAPPKPLLCSVCGRSIRISWPTRRVLCGCGAQVLPGPGARWPSELRDGARLVRPAPGRPYRVQAKPKV